MIPWTTSWYIIPFGVLQGKAVLRLNIGRDCSIFPELFTALAEDKQTTRIPLYFGDDLVELAQTWERPADVNQSYFESLRKTRCVWACHSARHAEPIVPHCWRTVLALDDDFYNLKCTTGDELICSMHVAHVLEDVVAATEFDYYYIMPHDDDSMTMAKEFVCSGANQYGWRLTAPASFASTTLGELERMVADDG